LKQIYLLLFIITLLSSCFTRRTIIPITEPTSQNKLFIITSEGFEIALNRPKHLEFLKTNINALDVSGISDSLYSTDTLDLSKNYSGPFYYETERFIIQELNNGSATITNIENKEKIRKVKRVTNYYKQSAIVRGSVAGVFFYDKGKKVFGKKYGRPHF
jgi:hypothetical protein